MAKEEEGKEISWRKKMGRYVAAGCEKKNNIARADVNEAVKIRVWSWVFNVELWQVESSSYMLTLFRNKDKNGHDEESKKNK